MPTHGPQGGVVDDLSAIYGQDYFALPPDLVTGAASPAQGGGPATDPHDRSDKGPSDWYEDPVLWLTGAAAVGAGIIGFRFHWGPGARASASVDIADEFSSIVGQVLLAIAGIAVFKLLVSKTKIRALQEFAAFI